MRALLALAAGAPLFAHAAPNVLVILADDFGIDKVGAYADDVAGYREDAAFLPATPTLDALASSGVRFTAAWATPVCSPSRAALLTGKHPSRLRVGDTIPEGPPLDPGVSTLADLLTDATTGEAYTAAAFGKWHLGTDGDVDVDGDWLLEDDEASPTTYATTANPLLFGFQAYWGGLLGSPEAYWDWTKTTATAPGTTVLTRETTFLTGQTVTDALAWIDVQPGPWFAYVAMNAPHTSEDYESYTEEDLDPTCHTVTCLGEGTCSNVPRAVYQAQVQCMDTWLDTLLNGIDPAVLADTIIVFAGDNGSPSGVMEGDFADRRPRTENGKGSVYETGVRVPLTLTSGTNWTEWSACADEARADGTCALTDAHVRSPGRTVATPVMLLDLYPTLLAQAGRAPPADIDGVDLSPCLWFTNPSCGGSPAFVHRAVYTERYEVWHDEGGVPYFNLGRAALRRGAHKLVASYEVADACVTYELYDVVDDRFERVDLAGTEPGVLHSLKRALHDEDVSWLRGKTACSP